MQRLLLTGKSDFVAAKKVQKNWDNKLKRTQKGSPFESLPEKLYMPIFASELTLPLIVQYYPSSQPVTNSRTC